MRGLLATLSFGAGAMHLAMVPSTPPSSPAWLTERGCRARVAL